MQWTNEQAAAITHDGSNLLVSAAAGSGKTAVLVERIMRLLCDADPVVDADRLLVVTFTNAAAAEMRQKIERALRRRLESDPKNAVLRRQQTLIQKAQISTVHAFCQSLLHQYFYACDVDPAFTIMDAIESDLLRKSVLADLIEERMQHRTASFRRLAETVCRRGDAALHETVLELHRYFAGLPFFETRLRDFCEQLSQFNAFDETVWGRYLLAAAKERLDEAKTFNTLAMNLAQALPGLEQYLPVLAADAEQLAGLEDASLNGWDTLYDALFSIKWNNLPTCKAPERTAVQGDRKGMKDAVKGMQKLIACSSAEQEDGLAAIAPVVTELCDLVCELDRRFSAAKKEHAALDFSDLEQKTLSLLYEKEGVESALAADIRALFDAVLVDEYQDTNETQELIFKAVSNGRNLFTVGDVKQSIYSFRGAVPQLFLDRAKRYESGEEPGCRIDLNRNFRSRSTVLAGINELFEKLMTEKTSELVYDEREALVFGQSAYEPANDPACRLCLLEVGKESSAAVKRAEAEWVSGEILRMVQSGQPIYENGTPRPIRFSDIAVLFRSDRLDGQELLKKLKEKGVPVVSERGPDFFEQTEVQTALSLLQVIDNPIQDIPLLAVLRSPIVGFNEDRLLRLRAAHPNGDFYSVLTRAAAEGDKAVYAFLKRLSEWRERAAQEPLNRFLQELFYETDLDLFYSVQVGGAARTHRLHQLIDLAAAFEAGSYRGLSAFVRRLNTMAEKGENPTTGFLPESDNAVKLLSIHKSKGLEFPVVFVCGIHKKLTYPNKSACLYHKSYGIAVDALDTRLQIRYPTAVSDVIRRAKASEELLEELRILYVALTRAKEHLILTGAVGNAETLTDRLFPYPITHARLLGVPNYLEWILFALAFAQTRPETVCGRYDSWQLDVVSTQTDVAETESVAEEKSYSFPDPSAETAAVLSYTYAHQAATQTPVKMTVTQLKRAAEEADGVLLHPKRVYALERPRFLQETRLTGAEEGDLIHRCFEHLSFVCESVDEQLTQLKSAGRITAEEESLVDRGMIEAFLKSALFARVRAATAVCREQSFETELDTAFGRMLVQGIVDCYFEEDGALVVVDYKTDRVDSPQDLAERYHVQLDCYARALGKLTGKPVKEKLIWAARFGTCVKV